MGDTITQEVFDVLFFTGRGKLMWHSCTQCARKGDLKGVFDEKGKKVNADSIRIDIKISYLRPLKKVVSLFMALCRNVIQSQETCRLERAVESLRNTALCLVRHGPKQTFIACY